MLNEREGARDLTPELKEGYMSQREAPVRWRAAVFTLYERRAGPSRRVQSSGVKVA